MSKSAMNKRLNTIEDQLGSDVSITVWYGMPPIHVQVSSGTGMSSRTELKLFDSMDEVDCFIETNYHGAEPVVLSLGDEVPSAMLYEWGE